MDRTLFPISPEMHIVLVIVAFTVFGLQFIRLRKKYQLLLAIAMPCTLLPYAIDNRTFFYVLGLLEAVALIAALILAKTVDRDPAEDKAPAAEEDAQA